MLHFVSTLARLRWTNNGFYSRSHLSSEIVANVVSDTIKGKINNTVEVAPGFIIDLDKKDKIVAIEIVGCADQLDVSKEYVEKAKKEVFVETYEFSYKIIISFNDGEKEIKQRVLK